MIKAVIVLSGGQDSATAAAMAVGKYGAERVAAITFGYGQRHSVEVKYARRIARRFGLAQHKLVKFGFYADITESALLAKSKDGEITRKRGAKCPTSVVEGRNAFFLMAAGVWAKTLGATEVWTGVSEADYSGYPDCRGEFIRAQERAMRLALDYPVKIVTPFMKKTKADEWAIADRLGIFELIDRETVTCYRGVPGAGCGECPACRLRSRGRKEYLARKAKKSK